MLRAFLAKLSGAVLLVGLGACGTSDAISPPPPPPGPGPATTVSKQAGDNQTATAGEAVATPPSVKVTDASSRPVANVAVSFAVASGGGTITAADVTTGTDGVAAVGSWLLGSDGGANTLTATVSGTGIAGNPATFSATGQLISFHPTANVFLTAGKKTYRDLTIPAGVTVTAAGEVTLIVHGPAVITGALVSTCTGLSLTADSMLTVTGKLDNSCTALLPGDKGASLHLVGKTGYRVDGATIHTAGNLTIADDPAFTASGSAFALAGASPAIQRGSPGVLCSLVNLLPANVSPLPPQAAPGANGAPTAGKGTDGAPWAFGCSGPMTLTNVTLRGQDGGDGGSSNASSNAVFVRATGGDGGAGGRIRFKAGADLSVDADSKLSSGNGGTGGLATALAQAGPGSKAPSSVATAGVGGPSGAIEFVVLGVLQVQAKLDLQVGFAGNGGSAAAAGADGAVGQDGGDASAFGGRGGDVPKVLLAGVGIGGTGSIQATGGPAGNGGNSQAVGGKGGKGLDPATPGGAGGSPEAKAGDGGDAFVEDPNTGVRVQDGGPGGKATYIGGNGGEGFDGCAVSPFRPGGPGGKGGSPFGREGFGGFGLHRGRDGAAEVIFTANGGPGGKGFLPANGGRAGAFDPRLHPTNPTIDASSFHDSPAGLLCAGPSHVTATVAVQADPGDLESGLMLVGDHTIDIIVNQTGHFDLSFKDLISGITLLGGMAGLDDDDNYSECNPAVPPCSKAFFTASKSSVTIGGLLYDIEFEGEIVGGKLTGTLTLTESVTKKVVEYMVTVQL